MKRTLLLILCLLLVMTFAACGEDTTPTPTDGPTDGPTDAPTEPPTDAPTEPPTDAPTDPPHEHSYTLTLSVDANCDGEGQKVYSCQCGDTYTETFPKTAHTFGDWYVATRPTMTETGTEARECGTCGHKETKTLAVLTNRRIHQELC